MTPPGIDTETVRLVAQRLNHYAIPGLNTMDSKGKVSQIFKNNPQGSRLRGRPKTDGGTVYKRILINADLKTG